MGYTLDSGAQHSAVTRPAPSPPQLVFDRRGGRDRRKKPRALSIVPLHNFDLSNFTDIAADFGCNDYAYVVTPNVDHIIRFCDDASFRELYAQAGFILNDSRLLSRVVSVAKGIRLRVCTGSDLTERLLAQVVKAGDRIVLVGATAGQASQLAHRFGLNELQHFQPPMGFINHPQDVEECLRFIEAQSPFRFCFIAVGSPQQEVLANQLRIRGVARGLTLCVGASIDFMTNVERRAPRWVQQAALEWAFRLVQDPRRLAKRYLIRGPRIFMLLKHIRFELLSSLQIRAKTDALDTDAAAKK